MAILTREEKGIDLSWDEMDTNLLELETSPNGKIFPKVVNSGILIDPDDPDFGWHDITSVLYATGGINSAELLPYKGGIKSYSFHEQDELFINFHIPHDYAMGTALYIHSHWSHNSTHVTGGSITWAYEMIYAKRTGEEIFPDPVIPSVVSPINVLPYSHLVHEVGCSTSGGSGVELNTDDIEVDGIIQCRVYLDSNDITTDDASTVLPFLHFVDLHYQSTGIGTKQKAPDFWT